MQGQANTKQPHKWGCFVQGLINRYDVVLPKQEVVAGESDPYLPVGFMTFYFACSLCVNILFVDKEVLLPVILL